MAIWVLDSLGFSTEDAGVAIVVTVISVTLATILLTSAQSGLNQYWQSVKGPTLRDARVGKGEIIMVLIGLVNWILTLFWWDWLVSP